MELVKLVKVEDWLYLVTWIDVMLERGDLLSIDTQESIARQVLSPADRRRAVEIARREDAVLFFRGALFALLRLVLTPEIPATAKEMRELGDTSFIGRLVLAASDYAVDPVTAGTIEAARADAGGAHSEILDLTLRLGEMNMGEGLRNSMVREHSLTLGLPRRLDPQLAARIEAQVEEGMGVSIEEYFCLGFALSGCYARELIGDGGSMPLYFDPCVLMGQIGVARERKDAFLKHFSMPLSKAREMAGKLAPGTPGFSLDTEWLEQRPSIAVEANKHIIPLHALALRRFTRGLSPLLRYSLRKSAPGTHLAEAFTALRARAAEVYVENLIESALGGRGRVLGKVPYVDDGGRSVKVEDVVACFGTDHILLLNEVKSGAVDRREKTQGSVQDLFKEDSQFDKALTTLARGVAAIRSGQCTAPGVHLNRFRWTVPIIVMHEPFLLNRLLRARIDAAAREKGLTVTPRVTAVALLDFEEVELFPVLEEFGERFAVRLCQWIGDAEERNESFLGFVQRRWPELLSKGSAPLRRAWDELNERMVQVFGFKEGTMPPRGGKGGD